MQVLILGHPCAERTQLDDLLAAGGHDVNVCHELSWGCVGMDDACPLDATGVDVAVAIAEPGDRFDPQGIACLQRARVPLVTIGGVAHDRILEYASERLERVDESVFDALARAARDGSAHQRAIELSVAEHLHSGESIDVSVDRSPDRIDVRLTGRLEGNRASVLADIARGAVRTHDAHVPVIDVSVDASGAETSG
jgi:hypothetical protein